LAQYLDIYSVTETRESRRSRALKETKPLWCVFVVTKEGIVRSIARRLIQRVVFDVVSGFSRKSGGSSVGSTTNHGSGKDSCKNDTNNGTSSQTNKDGRNSTSIHKDTRIGEGLSSLAFDLSVVDIAISVGAIIRSFIANPLLNTTT
jgi:hypothetical protein